jgi:hypothetical protein
MVDAFSYRATKGGEVHVTWRGRTVTTLRGAKASSFRARAEAATADEEARQELLRRATGNFKRGNERG